VDFKKVKMAKKHKKEGFAPVGVRLSFLGFKTLIWALMVSVKQSDT